MDSAHFFQFFRDHAALQAVQEELAAARRNTLIMTVEMIRRIALQLGFREAMILSNSVKAVAMHVASESWHRADVSLTFRERAGAKVTVGDILDCLPTLKVAADAQILIVFAAFYCDERLLRSLVDAKTNSALIDSEPPSIVAPLLE